MKEFIPNMITGFCALAGAWGGAIWNQRGNRELLKQQLIRDERKEARKESIETLEVYSKILKADGENTVVIDVADSFEEFDFSVYQKEIRPILYERYHLLHDEVAKIVAYIDLDIKRCNFFGEVEVIDHVGLCRDYNNLIRNVRKNIHDFRKEGSKNECSLIERR